MPTPQSPANPFLVSPAGRVRELEAQQDSWKHRERSMLRDCAATKKAAEAERCSANVEAPTAVDSALCYCVVIWFCVFLLFSSCAICDLWSH